MCRIASFPLLSSGKSSSALTACHWLTAWVNYHLHFGPITLLYLSTVLCFPSFLFFCTALFYSVSALCSKLPSLPFSSFCSQSGSSRRLGSPHYKYPPKVCFIPLHFQERPTFVPVFLVNCRSLLRRRQWHPTAVLLPGKSHGQWSLVGCSPWGH